MKVDPYKPPTARLTDAANVDPKAEWTLAVWWAITWRSFLLAIPIGIFLGIAFGAIAALNGYTDMGLAGQIGGWIASIIAYLAVLHDVLWHRRFPDFTITIEPRRLRRY